VTLVGPTCRSQGATESRAREEVRDCDTRRSLRWYPGRMIVIRSHRTRRGWYSK
jgi:hypothetical protein